MKIFFIATFFSCFVLIGCAPERGGERTPNEIAEDLCLDAGQDWKCITFSTGQEKCQCVAPGGPESFDPFKDQV